MMQLKTEQDLPQQGRIKKKTKLKTIKYFKVLIRWVHQLTEFSTIHLISDFFLCQIIFFVRSKPTLLLTYMPPLAFIQKPFASIQPVKQT